ncbi:prostaglandin G/H synthase 2-like [Pecten maximus]|uniref:prostaglandin G/H synthase 2-like n=1 Tax=Pecten maximus TaxID=6579 RepID=UPI0014587E77|nr:prostaglandin G/H synthase 2-like [Pecten maximus]XP_033732579.1 prostaglandin G/H synthase 2-like [Pecten maximus]XP_033732580.1 prostaglandin G/H synthase 2-like [Pecten maximus]XP_033732581.1 prostaglandin G/H synthase 2-like [Pecten maximus]XP_033732583.1 prostaglandin G/H synthase 2-like [Pecten maximus]
MKEFQQGCGVLVVLVVVMGMVSANNSCCSYPCQNGGVCMTTGMKGFKCDCTGTDFYGTTCETPTFIKRIKLWLKPSPDTSHYLLTHYDWLWNFVNSVDFLRKAVMKKVYTMRSNMVDSPATYTSEHSYITLDANFNMTYYTRTLPPVPNDCPTPMGIWGKKEMPDVDRIVKKFFIRKKFIPEPMGTSALFSFFAQHFTHQFFKTDVKKGPQYQWGGHGVDVTHVYGRDKDAEAKLRSFKDGKLKVQVIKGEEYPPLEKDAPVGMIYPPGTPENNRFAIGQQVFGLLPGLFMYATVWLREHNRVCDILKAEHPDWDDERLYQTGKLVILGETIKIVIEDYVQHLSHYNYKLLFRPELLFGEEFQYQNRIAVEFNHLYHWHPLMPSEFNISGTTYSLREFVYHPEILLKHGMHDFVDSLSKQRAGQFGPYNHGPMTIPVVTELIKQGRQLRLQPYNQYRKKFNLPPYKTFEDMTGNKELAKALEEEYHDIDAVEFYIGLIMEKRRYRSVFGTSIVEMGGPYSVKGLMANPICSPKYWKPSTFGGDVGFDIINTATLKTLFCNNIKGDCPAVTFEVPGYVEGDDLHDEL